MKIQCESIFDRGRLLHSQAGHEAYGRSDTYPNRRRGSLFQNGPNGPLVHHADYLVWFELTRTDLCARSGYHYADIERIGYRLLNIELQVRYRKPAHYGETVSVTCWIEDLASRAIRFAYEVRRDDELLVTGSTQHLWVEATSNQPCRTPEELRQPFRKIAGL